MSYRVKIEDELEESKEEIQQLKSQLSKFENEMKIIKQFMIT